MATVKTKGKPRYPDETGALIYRVYGDELKRSYPPENPLKILISWSIDYVPFWKRRRYNLNPVPCPPDTEAPLPMVDESLLPELITSIRRHRRRFGHKIARVSIGARPADAEKPAALQTIWEAV
jgi:hypothetical protein